MADPLPSLDLRLTPDWLKESESESTNRYADYADNETEGRGHRVRRERRDDRPRRPAQNRQRRDAGPARRDGGSNRPSSQSRPAARPHGQPGREGAQVSHPDRGTDGPHRTREEQVLEQV